MTLMMLRCMSKFLSSSMRVSRQKRLRMDLMEGRTVILPPLHFYNLFFFRFFGGRTVSALIYDQEMYDQQDFSV